MELPQTAPPRTGGSHLRRLDPPDVFQRDAPVSRTITKTLNAADDLHLITSLTSAASLDLLPDVQKKAVPAALDWTLYVSPDGDDAAAGTDRSAPLKTIEHAVSLAVASDKSTSIRLLDGTYHLGAVMVYNSTHALQVHGDSETTRAVVLVCGEGDPCHDLNTPMMYVSSATVSFSWLTIRGFNAPFAQCIKCHLSASNVEARENTATVFAGAGLSQIRVSNSSFLSNVNQVPNACGGALAAFQGAQLIVEDSYFLQNSAPTGACACAAQGSSLTVRSSTFRDNHGGGFGGGLATMTNSALDLEGSKFYGHTGGQGGASVYVRDSKGSIRSCEFYNDTSSFGGFGAVIQSTIEIIDVLVQGGHASAAAGAGIFQFSTVTMRRSRFIDNSATGNGGCVFLFHGSSVLEDLVFRQCEATELGGGVYMLHHTTVFDSASFKNCRSGLSGAGLLTQASDVTFSNMHFKLNVAQEHCGGMCLLNVARARVTDVLVELNDAGRNSAGMGVYQSSVDVILRNLTMFANHADIYFGGLSITEGSSAEIYDSTITDNSAVRMGGGLAVNQRANVIADGLRIIANDANPTGSNVYQSVSNLALSNSFVSSRDLVLGQSPLFVSEGATNITNTTIIGLTTLDSPGCLHLQDVNLHIKDSVMHKCFTQWTDLAKVRETPEPGGAMKILGISTVVIEDTHISDVRAIGGGSVAYVGPDSTLTLRRCNISDFRSAITGGFELRSSTLILEDSVISNGSVMAGYGGVVSADTMSTARLTNMRIFDVSAEESSTFERFQPKTQSDMVGTGGAVWLGAQSTLYVENSSFSNVEAERFGGVLYATQYSEAILTGVFTNHTQSRTESGGVIASLLSQLVITSSVFHDTRAAGLGGAIYHARSILVAEDVWIQKAWSHRGGSIAFVTCQKLFIATFGDRSAARIPLLRNVHFEDSSAVRAGGAMWYDSAVCYMGTCKDCTYVDVRAPFGMTRASGAIIASIVNPPPAVMHNLQSFSYTFRVRDALFGGAVLGGDILDIGLSFDVKLDEPSETAYAEIKDHGDVDVNPKLGLVTVADMRVNASLYRPVVIKTTVVGHSKSFDPNVSDATIFSRVQFSRCDTGQELSRQGNCKACTFGTVNLDGSGVCLPCPSGAVCLQTRVLASADHWQDPAHSSTPKKTQKHLADIFYACRPGYCCPKPTSETGGVENTAGSSTRQLVLGCNLEHACAPRRMGTLCGSCEQGYVDVLGNCIECRAPYNKVRELVVMGAVLFLALTVLGSIALWRLYPAVDSLLFFLQAAALIVGREGPERMARLALLNFNFLDGIGSSDFCFHDIRLLDQLLIQVGSIIAIWLMLVVVTVLWNVFHSIACCHLHNIPTVRRTLAHSVCCSWLFTSEVEVTTYLAGMCDPVAARIRLAHVLVRLYDLTLVGAVFALMSLTSCRVVSDVAVLQADPSVRCWEGVHTIWASAAVVLFVIFLLPIFILAYAAYMRAVERDEVTKDAGSAGYISLDGARSSSVSSRSNSISSVSSDFRTRSSSGRTTSSISSSPSDDVFWDTASLVEYENGLAISESTWTDLLLAVHEVPFRPEERHFWLLLYVRKVVLAFCLAWLQSSPSAGAVTAMVLLYALLVTQLRRPYRHSPLAMFDSLGILNLILIAHAALFTTGILEHSTQDGLLDRVTLRPAQVQTGAVLFQLAAFLLLTALPTKLIDAFRVAKRQSNT